MERTVGPSAWRRSTASPWPPPRQRGTIEAMRTYFQVRAGRLDEVKGEVVREQPLTIYIDGERFLTLLCSPFDLEALVLGSLWMERVIGSLDEVAALRICEIDGQAEV